MSNVGAPEAPETGAAAEPVVKKGKSRRQWILLLGLVVFVLVVVFLARPTDDMAPVNKLKAFIYAQHVVKDKDDPYDPGETAVLLRATREDIQSVYPDIKLEISQSSEFPMPPGREAMITRLGNKGLPGPKEEWKIIVQGDDRTWYAQAIAHVRGRLGL